MFERTIALVGEENFKKIQDKTILIVGLGGVGGRIVDNIMERVPEKYRPYTQAVSIDTDKNEISVLKNIPIQNQIAIGEDMTIGSFMRDNEDSAEWMVKGDQLLPW